MIFQMRITQHELDKLPDQKFWQVWTALGDLLKAKYGIGQQSTVAYVDFESELEGLRQAQMG